MRIIVILTTLLLTLLSVPSASAAGLLWARQVIYGMDCAPCAYGIEQGLKKLPGVRTVTVSLNDGYAEIELESENGTNIDAVRGVVLRNGFTPKSAEARLAGTLEIRNEKLYLNTTDTRLELTAPVELKDRLYSLAGQQAVVNGQIPADHNDRLHVRGIQTEAEPDNKMSISE